MNMRKRIGTIFNFSFLSAQFSTVASRLSADVFDKLRSRMRQNFEETQRLSQCLVIDVFYDVFYDVFRDD